MRPVSLRRKIIRALLVLFIVGFAAMAFTSAVVQYRRDRARLAAAMDTRIVLAGSVMRGEIYRYDAVVRRIIADIDDSRPASSLPALIGRRLQFHTLGDVCYLLDGRGRVRSISSGHDDYLGLDLGAVPLEDAAPAAPGEPQVGHYQSLLTQSAVIGLAYRLPRDWTLVVERDLQHVTTAMEPFIRTPLLAGEAIFALSPSGRVIYHPDSRLVRTRHNLGFDIKERSADGGDGLFSYRYDGVGFIARRLPIRQPDGWTMYYAVPRTELLLRIARAVLLQASLLALLFAGFLAVVHFYLARFFADPVSRVTAVLRRSGDRRALSLAPEMAAGIAELDEIIAAIGARDQAVNRISAQISTILDSLDAVVYAADMESHELLMVNRYLRNAIHYRGDLEGRKCWEVLQKDQRGPCPFCTNDRLLTAAGEPVDGGCLWEFRNTVNGRWYECRDQAIRWTDGRPARLEIATDITWRKEVEQALTAETERLAVTLRSIGDGVIATDDEARVMLMSVAAEELTGWNQHLARGRPVGEVLPLVDEETGMRLPVLADQVMADGLSRARETPGVLEGSENHRRLIAESGAPIRGRDGAIIGTVQVFRDITTQLRTEEELRKAQKLESISVLAGGIAHDFNNILMGILGNISLARSRLAADSPVAALLQKAENASQRARGLTRQMLTFARGGEPVKELSALGPLLRESVEFVLHGGNIVGSIAIPDNLWPVEIDRGQIDQVVHNLILNARQAMPGGGRVTVAAANVADGGSESFPGLPAARFVRVTVADTGPGIPPRALEKIFDPFFTTKPGGSGLGLSVCHSIVKKHDGHMFVRSSAGAGAAFTFYLPAVDRIPPVPPPAAAPGNHPGLRILVMDDDDVVRMVAAEMLGCLGHTVAEATNGEEMLAACEEARAQNRAFDIVFMDLTIPGGMGGREGIRRLLERDPAVRVIVFSGYSNDECLSRYRDFGFRAALVKPFTIDKLAAAISEVLSSDA
ncbi:MAG: response regulator [Deltaproteobacteria bacterium]|nr:response regulator [Candidatus Anaeroferrophillacea bacterium]